MKKILKFFPFLFLLLFPFLAFSQWSKVADLPQYKWRLAGFSIGTKGYIVGGITETATTFTGANPSANLWIYDSQTDTWSAGPDFPGGNIRRAFVFVINDIAYVGSGENTGFYAYDPSTNAWTQKANRPNVGEFYQAIGFTVNGVGYAGMGGSANLYKYTPSTNTWSTAIATGIPTRGSAFVFVYNNKAYIGGGNNGGTYYNTFYQFDPATNTSTQLANYPTLYTLYSYGFSNAQGGGVASGYAGYNNHHTYNVTTNTWTAATSIPSSPQWGTQEAAGFNIGSNLYIIGGTPGSTALNRTIKFTNVVLSPTITALSPNPVTTGQTLTITGTNFTGTTSVTINGTSVPFTVASATSITVVVPAGTLTGNVVVSTASGSSTAVPLTVINLPTISSIANQTIGTGGTTSALNFTVSDAETAATSLVVSATSTNTSLVPISNIALSGTGANRVLSVTASANQTGIAKITLTVTDQDGNTANTTFAVIVNGASEPLVLAGGTCVGVGALSASVKPDFAANIAGWSGAGLGTSGFYGTLRLAQTFLQKSTLPVNRVSLLLNRAGNTSDFPIKVYIKNTDVNGKPGDVTLGEANIANLSPTNFGQNSYTFQFNTALQLTAGIKYTLVFEALSGSITASPSGGDAYPDGTQFESSDMINWTASSFTGNDVIFSMNYVPTTNEFVWYKDGALVPSITTASYTPSDAGSYMVILNPVGLPASTASNAIILNPVPTVNQPTNVLVQNGTATPPVIFTGAVSSTSYAWTSSNTSFGLSASGTGNIASFAANYTGGGNVQQVVSTIVVTPSANGCVGTAKTFTFTLNLNAAPTNISLSKANLFEANALGATVGNLSSTDPDVGDTHTYALVGGSGGGDNASFTIVGNQLKANAVFNFATKRLYAVRIRTTDAGGLPFEKEFLISISKTPIVLGTGNVPSTKKQTPPSANPSISKGYSSFLTVTGENLTGYSWSPSTGLSANNISNPVASPAQTTTYNVTVTNGFGSSTVVPISITVLDDYNVTPNNLLTPNGDGLNDTWAVENIASYPNNEIKVVDKAGRLVFTQKGYANTWDGANLTPDTYYYIIIFGPDVAPKKGFITIIR
jgi:gliding motility-associated-like protein